ncbi:glutamine synthetase type III, partial [bacterium]|nr:glutamine synthetase type III [bacterium]
GIPVTTRHNEVAPSQYEFAPVFERAHIATDHNLLTMAVMKRVAHEHGFECLLHEKPFAGVNGSGKHNNWSLADDRGNNLLDPGSTPHENAQFLVFLTAVLRAVHGHADLLRASIATPGNDHRLGANEAPPAIISVFLGETLTEVVKAIISGEPATVREKRFLYIGVSSLPPLPSHDSDRNRTSPFAFTGSKFEFRAVGSGQNIARPNMILNTIVAESLCAVCDRIEAARGAGKSLNDAVQEVLRTDLREHESVIFNGDNYSTEWHAEAARRGLPNLPSCVEALPAFITPKAIALFGGQGVLNEEELQSRYRIKLDGYIKTVAMEAALMSNLGRSVILPVCFDAQNRMAVSTESARAILGNVSFTEQVEFVARYSTAVTRLMNTLENLDRVVGEAENHGNDPLAKASFQRSQVLPAMAELRTAADSLELLTDDAVWPLPKYREMLFLA